MRGKAQGRAVTGDAVAQQTASSAFDDAAAEVAAAEGATEAAAEARAAAPAKPARAPPPAKPAPPPREPTSRQQANQQAKEKDMFKTLQDECKMLSDKLKQAEKEKQQLKDAQKAKGVRRASQEQKPQKSNSARRDEKVCVETNHIDRNVLSFDAVRKPGCISPAGYLPITTQLVYYLTTLFSSVDI